MIGTMSAGQMLFFLALAVLLFGNRLPAVGKSLGEGIRNFKKGLNGQDDLDTQPTPAATAQAPHAPGSSPSPGPLSGSPEVVAHTAMNPQLQPPHSHSPGVGVVDVEHKV